MVCNKCNTVVQDGGQFCPNCGNNLNGGTAVNNNVSVNDNLSSNNQDKTNIWLVVLSWFIPIAGFIIFFVQKKSSPKTAKASGICALISAILNVIIVVLVFRLILGLGAYTTNKTLEKTESIFDDVVDKIEENVSDDTDESVNEDDETLNDSADTVIDNANISVSNDWKQYQVAIAGKTLTLPMAYSELVAATGFTAKSSDADSVLSNNYYAMVNMYKNEKLALYIEVMNTSGADVKYSDCNVTRISQTKYQISQGADPIVFPGGIKAGDAITDDQIIALFGTPNDIKDYGTSKQYTYLSDTTWTTVNNFKIKVVDGIVDEIALDHRG